MLIFKKFSLAILGIVLLCLPQTATAGVFANAGSDVRLAPYTKMYKMKGSVSPGAASVWALLTGPRTGLDIKDKHDPKTIVYFTGPGEYQLLLIASDGIEISSAAVKIYVGEMN